MASSSDKSSPSVHGDPWTSIRDGRDGRSDRSLIGALVGSYRLTRRLGEGSAGVVYLGEHPLVGARVAIKILHDHCADSPGMLERFINEAKAANLIQSPHIVRCSDFGSLPNGSHYAVMEYLEGQTLEQYFTQRRSLDFWRAAEICRQVAVAMSAAHAAGIIHRDLKPANVFIEFHSNGPFVRILDFGVAKLLESTWQSSDPDSTSPKSTLHGQVLGTPLYCSPEQGDGNPVTNVSDIYSLGAIAYELVSGRPPIEGDNLVQIFLRKSTLEPTPIQELCPDIPPDLARLIMQMLERDPVARPVSMEDVVQRLEAILPSAPAPFEGPPAGVEGRTTLPSAHSGTLTAGLISAPSTSQVRVASARSPQARRDRRGAGMLAAVCVLGVAALAFHWTHRSEVPVASPPPPPPSSEVVVDAGTAAPVKPEAAPIPVESLAAAPAPSARRTSAGRKAAVPPAPTESARPAAAPVNSAGKIVNPFE